MYLTLRVPNIDEVDNDGKNVFLIYLERGDIYRCTQFLKRGSNINMKLMDLKTPLHFAIEMRMAPKFINFLLDFGANPHIEDM
jgi:ankyrin repeat protein